MAIRKRNVADIARPVIEGASNSVSGKHRHASLTCKVILPLVIIGMPVELPHGSGLDLNQGGSDGLRDREVRRIHDSHASAWGYKRPLGQETVLEAERNGAVRGLGLLAFQEPGTPSW